MLNQALPSGSLATLPLARLSGVGPRTAGKLEKLGLKSVQDLLFHLPLRYEDRTRITPIAALRLGDHAVVEGEVVEAEIRQGKRRSLLVSLADRGGSVTLRFFHFGGPQTQALRPGNRLRCFGEARQGPMGVEMVHPEYRLVDADKDQGMEEALTPIYPTTEGLHQTTWRGAIQKALERLERDPAALPELLPAEFREPYQWPELAEAVRYLHRPPPDVRLDLLAERRHPAQQRLAFEELLAHQISLRRMRRERRAVAAPELKGDGGLRRALLAALPFQPTAAQVRVTAEIEADLLQDRPMLRLVQGDVGAGKTLVAALAALQSVEAGFQAAVMAPTELLAEQHLRSLRVWLEPLGIAPAWLTGRHKGNARREIVTAIASGEAKVVIGTHALFQGDVAFRALGLVIIDEQHRFGVHQRMALHEKGRADGRVPHQLIMTATPIPRTLAMTAYADLDLSIIDELPPGRTPVTTVAIPDTRREEVMERVRAACRNGRQAYWVCTLIEESEQLQAQAAEETAQTLAELLPDLRIGLIHGRLHPTEKEAVMSGFKGKEFDLLVATTVIEVGVDVPNASLMIIENPERLGLAQLHQLRGRVGRGTVESHCVLMYHPPLSQQAQQRLGVLRATNDGFEIARKDLELRGPGEVLGTRQTGEMQFRIADPLRDQELIEQVQPLAERLLERHPENAARLVARWLGERVRYIHA